jgi:hypothetical protein
MALEDKWAGIKREKKRHTVGCWYSLEFSVLFCVCLKRERKGGNSIKEERKRKKSVFLFSSLSRTEEL